MAVKTERRPAGRWKRLLQGGGGQRLLVVLGLLGMTLILLSQLRGRETSAGGDFSQEAAEYARELETRLCEMVGRMEGVGACRVLVTLENGSEYVYGDRSQPVTERMPEPETDVLAVCNRNGYIFVIPAIYEDGKLLTQESAWNWSDIYCYGLYDEEADDYYIPEGWWENRQFNPDDVYNNPVDCAVTHWMPLPDAPEATEEGGKHE